MTHLPTENLIAAAARLIQDIGTHSTKDKDNPLELQRIEHCAKALTAQLKAIQDLDAHNLRQKQSQSQENFTLYEDLPPLAPADRDRLKDELIDLLSPRDTAEDKPSSEPLSKGPKSKH